MHSSHAALSENARLVHAHDRDRFLCTLFVPQENREGMFAIAALAVELSSVAHKTSEEMIGQVRLAWWQEAIDALYAAKPAPPQPVLQGLDKIIDEGQLPQNAVMPLIEEYRAHFPNPPPDKDALLDHLVLSYIRLACPDAEAGWHKAHEKITSHRRRWKKRLNSWLALKLLMTRL